jgi:aminoglycoside phosphotransferase family enzyme/predicted kinase
MNAPSALELHEQLIAGLLRPAAYPERVDRVERLDTHISTVLLAGAYAYKIKKPVNLGFLDFSTREQRLHYCMEELRLNQRTAPQIYLDVVAIVGSRTAPRIGLAEPARREGVPLEYAVRMRRFDNSSILDRLAQRRRLSAEHVERLAAAVASLHRKADRAPAGFGTPASVAHWADENFLSMRSSTHSAADRGRLDALAQWSAAEHRAQVPRIAARSDGGFVRECHGDLHLGNIVLLDGVPVPFDAIEFSAELRLIDVVSDIAFTFMDLLDHDLPHLAWHFVSAYLEHTGDYDGLALLRFYSVYRALVRAKVALIHLHQPQLPQQVRLREHTSFEHYLALAERLRQRGAPLLIVMTGLSGAGKSTVALALAERVGGVRIRSDVERKRLYGLEPEAKSDGSIYTAEATSRTYERLATAARAVAAAGVPAIVDAAFLKREERLQFRALAGELGVRHALVVCEAPTEVLRARVAARAALGADPSEAGVEVLERQRRWREPLGAEEHADATVIDTATAARQQQDGEALAARLLGHQVS